MKTSKIF